MTVLLAVLAWQAKQLYDHNGRLSSIEADVASVRRDVNSIKDLLFAIRLKQSAANFATAADLAETQRILDTAREEKVKIDPEILRQVGGKLFVSAENNPSAWQATRALLEYRSFLNHDLAPDLPNKVVYPVPSPTYRFGLNYAPPQGFTMGLMFEVWVSGNAPPEKSALLDILSQHVQGGSGAEFLIVDGRGGTITLDDERMRNVIVLNSNIKYFGGPTLLRNIYFVNCTFDFRKTPHSIQLAATLLASAATNFDVG